jgi:hypothetical protein
VGLPNKLSNSSVAVITAEDGKHLLEASHENNGIRLNFTHSPSFYGEDLKAIYPLKLILKHIYQFYSYLT